MSKIKIKNFGPIKEGCLDDDGWIDVKKVTVFIGNQGSGKSTVAKLISTMSWIEKALVRGDYKADWFEKGGSFKLEYLIYHRLENYVDQGKENLTLVDYWGDAFQIRYEHGNLHILQNQPNGYPLPQIMYVPAERNFVANVKDSSAIDLTSEALKEFAIEYGNAMKQMKGPMQLPVNNIEVEYSRLTGTLFLKGSDYKLAIAEASSGFQSLVPLYLVSWYLSKAIKEQSGKISSLTGHEMERFKKGVSSIWENDLLTEEQRRAALSVLASKFNKSAFINIVEEPEQNLFPTSQWEMLKSLLEFNNMNEGNKLIMTTHSPYMINYLTLAVKAATLKPLIKDENTKQKLNNLVPLASTVNPEDLAIYEMDEKVGTIKKLETYHGLPSDENELNLQLGESNELFAQLLEIQQQL